MRQGVLITILIIICFAATAWAENPEEIELSPYKKNIIYQQEAATYIKYVKNHWKIFEIGTNSIRRIEQSTKAEYRTDKIKWTIQLELEDLKPAISTKIQFFKKPIYFVFTVSN